MRAQIAANSGRFALNWELELRANHAVAIERVSGP